MGTDKAECQYSQQDDSRRRNQRGMPERSRLLLNAPGSSALVGGKPPLGERSWLEGHLKFARVTSPVRPRHESYGSTRLWSVPKPPPLRDELAKAQRREGLGGKRRAEPADLGLTMGKIRSAPGAGGWAARAEMPSASES